MSVKKRVRPWRVPMALGCGQPIWTALVHLAFCITFACVACCFDRYSRLPDTRIYMNKSCIVQMPLILPRAPEQPQSAAWRPSHLLADQEAARRPSLQ